MKALVFGGPGKRSWTEVADPQIRHPQDAIIRVDARDHLRYRPAHSRW